MAYIDAYFKVLIETGASDLHLGEGQPAKIRRHGEIVHVRIFIRHPVKDDLHRTLFPGIDAAGKILRDLHGREHGLSIDPVGDFRLRIHKENVGKGG